MKWIRKHKRYSVWLLALLMTIGAIVYVIRTNYLPFRYVVCGGCALFVILGAFFLIQMTGKRKRTIACIIFEILICAGLGYGCYLLYHADHMISRITQTVEERDAICVYVYDDSPYDSMECIPIDATCGTAAGPGYLLIQQYMETDDFLFPQESMRVYDDIFLAADALQNGEIELLWLSVAQAGLISGIEGYEWFDTDAVQIGTYEVSIVMDVVTDGTDESKDTSEADGSKNPEGNLPEEDNGDEDAPDRNEPEQAENQKPQADTKPQNDPKPPIPQLIEEPEYVDWESLVSQEMLDAPEGTFVLYMSGADTWGSAAVRSRSDVNILAVVNTNTKKILLVSTPRDYYVPLSISKGVKDKLTHAGIYGVQVSMDTLGLLYGVNVDYYLKVNFTGFVGIIDALGGVEVYSDSTFSVGDAFYYTEGMNSMNGIEALAFARERYSFAIGDRARGTHQMEVIKAVISKCASAAVLNHYSDVMNAMSGCFSTNLSKNTIASLVRMQLDDMTQWSVSSISVDGTGDTKSTYSVPSKKGYVMIPDELTVQIAKDQIAAVLRGE